MDKHAALLFEHRMLGNEAVAAPQSLISRNRTASTTVLPFLAFAQIDEGSNA